MRGIEIELGGKVRLLRFDFNAIADIEERAGVGIGTLLGAERVGLHAMRLLLWGGLKHEERGLTVQRVGTLVGEYIDGGGDISALGEKLAEAINASGLGNSDAEAVNE
jgi:hypothetical protein